MSESVPHFSYFAGSRVHLGLTGSVACYRVLDLCRSLVGADMGVSACLTEAAGKFVTPLSLRALGADPVREAFFQGTDQAFPHLEPGQQTDALLVAPATADFLAKMACGLADDLLSCQVLAHLGPVIAAPAMNPKLWHALATQTNVATLRERGIRVLEPESGDVACGETGRGKLPGLEEIYLQLLKALAPQDMQGLSVLVTMGPTREYLDPVRYWSNPSSGKMGAAVATAAWLRGARVYCVSGPSDVALPGEVERYNVQSAREMYSRCLELWPGVDAACLCAAVCDLRPAEPREDKLKKEDLPQEETSISFARNPDILLSLGRDKGRAQKLVGFAAETGGDLHQAASSKLEGKNLDLILANRVSSGGTGFASDTNQVLFLDRKGAASEQKGSKGDIAWRLWDWIANS